MLRIKEIGDHPQDLFRFALDNIHAGIECVLIIITLVEGSSSRRVGTPMVVLEDGRFAGYVSSGCLDVDIASQALETLATNDIRKVRYGKGSPYIDLKLPCGGGLDVIFIPRPEITQLERVTSSLENRKPARFILPVSKVAEESPSHFDYVPRLRMMVFGEGVETDSFVKVSKASDLEVILNADVYNIKADEWTAIILLFHDHDKEIDILKQAVTTSAFYIGAMGSRKSQNNRLLALSDVGLGDGDISKIRGPIGLVPSTRDAGRLAVSILGEIFELDRLRTI